MLIRADARALPLSDACVQCVVTSPPYFGLRDYGVAGQLGLESTCEAYMAALVGVFAEVRRVLAADGVVWLNVGDSYNCSPRGNAPGDVSTSSLTNPQRQDRLPRPHGATSQRLTRASVGQQLGNNSVDNLKAKDLLMIPARVALALQADGWYLRSDIIWSKPNPMPESVTDRPTKAHEYLFLLAKSEKYFYDADAIAEPVSAAMLSEVEQGYDGLGLKDYDAAGVQNPSSVKARIIANARNKQSGIPGKQPPGFLARGETCCGYRKNEEGFNDRHDDSLCLTRNKRSVWTVNTQPYQGAHFATMPEALVEPCILAGSRFGDLVLDPFSGSGTVLAVAERFGRRAVGVDLNPAYHQLAKERTAQRGLRFEAGDPIGSSPEARRHA